MTYKEILDKLIENVKLIDEYIKAVVVSKIPEGQYIRLVIGDRNLTLYISGKGNVFLNDSLLRKADAERVDANFTEWRPFLADIKEGL